MIGLGMTLQYGIMRYRHRNDGGVVSWSMFRMDICDKYTSCPEQAKCFQRVANQACSTMDLPQHFQSNQITVPSDN